MKTYKQSIIDVYEPYGGIIASHKQDIEDYKKIREEEAVNIIKEVIHAIENDTPIKIVEMTRRNALYYIMVKYGIDFPGAADIVNNLSNIETVTAEELKRHTEKYITRSIDK